MWTLVGELQSIIYTTKKQDQQTNYIETCAMHEYSLTLYRMNRRIYGSFDFFSMNKIKFLRFRNEVYYRKDWSVMGID